MDKEENMRGFQGLFLTKESEELLRDQAESLGIKLSKWVNDTHITFNSGELKDIPEKKAKVTVVGYGSDGKNSGFKVEIPKELEKYYEGADTKHVTISLSQSGKAVDTKDLSFIPLKPFVVSGTMSSVVFK
jgi:predicted SPOUT superfamily RNA methylase MTH1